MSASADKQGQTPFFSFAALLLASANAVAQTASPMTPPPKFPQAAPFDGRIAPLSARQQASMVRITGGRYSMGSPPNHPLADAAAMPRHEVSVRPFRLDRTEVTSAQFAEFLNALPAKPSGTAPGGKVSASNIPQAWHAVLLE